MNRLDLYSLADEEARRLIEKDFSYDNPYTCVMDDEEIPHLDRDLFYQLVEDALKERGYLIINRRGPYFKIAKYNI